MLSSVGEFTGQLNNIVVDGTTETPDFSLDTANHPMPLHTKFHAVVDGTNGDTYLQPVDARLTEGIGGVIPDGSPATRQAMADLAWVSVHGFAMLALGGELDRDGTSGAAFARRLDAVLQVIAEAMAR